MIPPPRLIVKKAIANGLMQKTDSAESIFKMHGKLMIKQKIFRAAQII